MRSSTKTRPSSRRRPASPAIAAYNELSNPNALRIGQELRIPPPGYQPPEPEPEPEESTDFATGPLSPG